MDNPELAIVEIISNNHVTPEEFNTTEVGHSMMRYTFHIVTQISTSRELNRVSPNSITERSTRYVDESEGVIVRPHWMSNVSADEYNENQFIVDSDITGEAVYISLCNRAFEEYKGLINSGFKRQDARGVLPLDTATEVVYTYSIDEWKHIIELRSSKRAHPNCRIIANMIKTELEKLGYEF